MTKPLPPELGRNKARVDKARLAVERLIADHPTTGITNRMLQREAPCDSNHAGTVLSKMTHQGVIHGAHVQGHPKHWFGSAEAAQAWIAATPGIVKPEPVLRPPMLKRAGQAKSFRPAAAHCEPTLKPAGMPAPVTLGKAPRGGEPLVPEGLQVQYCYSPKATARWQLLPEAPDERWPAFAASRPGINPDTGKAWETRA